MRKPRVVSIGEVLWDLLPSGPQLGGAPANLAGHLHALHNEVTFVSRVGNDPLGNQARALLAGRGLDLSALRTDASLPTGTVTVDLDATGQPRYSIQEGVAWDAIEADATALGRMRDTDAVCFGTLAQRNCTSRDSIRRLVALSGSSCVRLCDLNLRAPFHGPEIVSDSCTLASVVKLNDSELEQLSTWFHWTGSQQAKVLSLAKAFQLEEVVLTLGSQGSCVWHRGQWLRHDAPVVQAVDTVGAGDAFTAAYLSGRLRGLDLEQTLQLASNVAAFVCTQPGGLPKLPEVLTKPFQHPPSIGGVDPGSTRS